MEYEARDRNHQYMMKAMRQRDDLNRLFALMGLVEAVDERERMSGAIEDAHDVSPIFAWQDGQLVDVTEWYKAMVKVWAPSSDGEHAGIDDGLVMPPTDHDDMFPDPKNEVQGRELPCCYQRDQGCCPFDHPMWEQMCSRKSLGDCPVEISASRELPVPPCHRVEEKTCAYIAPAGLKPQIVGRGGEANDEPLSPSEQAEFYGGEPESLVDYCDRIKTLNECRGQHELCDGCEEFLKSQTERDRFLLVFGPDDPRPTKKMSAQEEEEEEFRKFETAGEFVRRVFKPMRHAWKIVCEGCGEKLVTGDRIVVQRTSRGIITGGLYDEDEKCVRHEYYHEFCPVGGGLFTPVPESSGECGCEYCVGSRPAGGMRQQGYPHKTWVVG